MTNGWTDVANADVVLVMGGNPAENHPVGFRFVMEAKRLRKAKIVCIDPRFTTLSWQYMGLLQGVSRDKLEDNYSHFVMAGGPIGAVHPKFEAWHKTYWDNLDVTVSLHHIKRVVGVTHRDCGAAKLAFGEAAVSKRESETESHSEALAAFRDMVKKRHPKLSVITGIMDVSGKVDLVG